MTTHAERINLALATGALIALSTAAHADDQGSVIIEIDVTGWQTFGGFGTPGNTRIEFDVRDYDVGAIPLLPIVTGIGYDVQIMTLGASWLSEVAFAITTAPQQPNGNGVAVASTTSPGTGTFTSGGIIKFDEFQTTGGGFLSPVIDNDYMFALEVFDTYDDGGTAVQDAVLFGTVFIQVEGFVPAPAPLALLGIAPIITPRRRRRS